MLEAFEVDFDEGPAEVRVDFDDDAIIGEAIEREVVGDSVGLATIEEVRESVGDTV